MIAGINISKSSTSGLKGLFALLVVFAHCRNFMSTLNDTILGMALTAAGYLSVSVFFFLSGYGVETQHKIYGDRYIRSFPKNRILPLLVLYVVGVLVYAVIDRLIFQDDIWPAVLRSFFFGYTIMRYGWYFQAALIMYLLYYVSRSFLGKRQWAGLLVGVSFYVGISLAFSKNPMLYCESALSFPLGVIVASKQQHTTEDSAPNWFALTGTFMLFVFTTLAGNLPIGMDAVQVVSKIISAVSFALFVAMAANKWGRWVGFAKRLGLICLEIYMIQEFPIRFFRSAHLYIDNDWLYLGVVVAVTLALAMVAHPLINKLTLAVKKCGDAPHNKQS